MTRFRSLTEEEIDDADTVQLTSWLDRAMHHLYFFLSKDEYHAECTCWALKGKITIADIRNFLKTALHKVLKFEQDTGLSVI